jgi:choline dehydrogenase-like flavoprotein
VTFASSTPELQDDNERVWANQRRLASSLKAEYDVIICGAGTSGSVIARRSAENPNVNVLLLEAGGRDDVAAITDPALWPTNLGTERDWGFTAQPNPLLNGRAMSAAMGKVLGGGSSINVMGWARGHKNDWDLFASESGNPRWGYDAVLDTYRRIEDWHGIPDPEFRGSGGPAFVAPAADPQPHSVCHLGGRAVCRDSDI